MHDSGLASPPEIARKGMCEIPRWTAAFSTLPLIDHSHCCSPFEPPWVQINFILNSSQGALSKAMRRDFLPSLPTYPHLSRMAFSQKNDTFLFSELTCIECLQSLWWQHCHWWHSWAFPNTCKAWSSLRTSACMLYHSPLPGIICVIFIQDTV